MTLGYFLLVMVSFFRSVGYFWAIFVCLCYVSCIRAVNSVVAMFARFREELKRIGEAIVERNKERESEVKYPYLLPDNISNYINI